MPDSRFDLPDLGSSAEEEAGVILLGLDPDRLLAGLGFAGLATVCSAPGTPSWSPAGRSSGGG
jgi:hypothetical protein